MPDTVIWDLSYPNLPPAGAGPDVPADIKALADSLDTKLTPFSQGLLEARPNFGKAGQGFRATDGQQHSYLDIGTRWFDLGPEWGAGIIGTAELVDDAVSQAKLADDSVGLAQMLPNAVGSAEIIDGSIGIDEMANALKPSAGAAAATEALRALGNQPGTAAAGNDARLADARAPLDNSVTNAKMADDAVGPAEVIDKSLTAAQIADNAVTLALMADDSVGAAELVDLSVGSAALAALAVIEAKLADGAVTRRKVKDNGDILVLNPSPSDGAQSAFTAIGGNHFSVTPDVASRLKIICCFEANIGMFANSQGVGTTMRGKLNNVVVSMMSANVAHSCGGSGGSANGWGVMACDVAAAAGVLQTFSTEAVKLGGPSACGINTLAILWWLEAA